MNEGKICVSICAETADELVEKVTRAKELADVIEIRFDCLKNLESEDLWQKIGQTRRNFAGEFLATFRPSEQGGKGKLSIDQRERFWIDSPVFKNADWADLEFDFSESAINRFRGESFSLIIKSFHDFKGVPANLEDVYQNLSGKKTFTVPKIAVQTEDITDTIPIWKLLKKAKTEKAKIIPIAMGESGKWTRILGLAHGALMTYASLDSSSETAPGQVSARDLVEVYRAKQLNENTEIFGILGSNTSVSLSPYIHNEAFKFHKLNSVFVPLQVQNLEEFMRRMVKFDTREISLNFRGFAVTIPHKQSIMSHLDFLDDSAKAVGAVNTVKIIDGKFHGYNTDAHGFIEPLLNSYGDLKNAKVAVLGAGGAARACVYALKKHDARVTVFARDVSKARNLAEEFNVEHAEFQASATKLRNYENFDILVNTTPLGMKGKAEGETPAVADQLKGLNLVYDLIYTPFQTALMNEADRAEVPKIGGLAMLIAQAIEQQKIWTGLDAPMKEMSRAAIKRLR